MTDITETPIQVLSSHSSNERKGRALRSLERKLASSFMDQNSKEDEELLISLQYTFECNSAFIGPVEMSLNSRISDSSVPASALGPFLLREIGATRVARTHGW